MSVSGQPAALPLLENRSLLPGHGGKSITAHAVDMKGAAGFSGQ
jgi:hypothetical protein